MRKRYSLGYAMHNVEQMVSYLFRLIELKHWYSRETLLFIYSVLFFLFEIDLKSFHKCQFLFFCLNSSAKVHVND